MDFKIFKIVYRVNYLDFYFVLYHCNVIIVLELHFSQLLSVKLIVRCVLKCKKFVCHSFSCQSLLLSTNTLNDNNSYLAIEVKL